MAKKDFLSAILLSLLWHIFWIYGVDVYIVRKQYSPLTLPAIFYLGSIAANTATEFHFKEDITINKIPAILLDKLFIKPTPSFQVIRPKDSEGIYRASAQHINLVKQIKTKESRQRGKISLPAYKLSGDLKEDLQKWLEFKSSCLQ